MVETTYSFPEQNIFQFLKLVSKFQAFLLVQVLFKVCKNRFRSIVKLGYYRKRHVVLCLVNCKQEPVNANMYKTKQFSIVLQSSPDWIFVRNFWRWNANYSSGHKSSFHFIWISHGGTQ
jgi:hypothetical protein